MNTQLRNVTATEAANAPHVDLKLEVAVIPVSDVDRAKRFYSGLGWRLDADFAVGDAFRVVSSRRRARRPPSTSARASHQPRQAQAASISSCRTSKQRAPSSSATESIWVRYSISPARDNPR